MGYCAIGYGKVKITADLTAKELAIIGEGNDKWCFHFEKGEFVTYSGCVVFECENPECSNSCCVYCGNGRCHAAAVRSEYRGMIKVDPLTNVVMDTDCPCFVKDNT